MLIFSAFAGPDVRPPTHEGYRSDRLARRVVAPREVVDLQGEWLTAHTDAKVVRNEPIPRMDGGDYQRKIYEISMPDFATQWKSVEIPFWEPLDKRFCLWAKRKFTLPKLNGRKVLVRFEAIEDSFVVNVNGREFPQTDAPGFNLSWVRDITAAVKEGENEIVIDFRPVDFPSCKFLSRRGGAVGHWGATRGIRGPVQIEIVNPVRIEDVFVKTFVEGGKTLAASVSVKNDSSEAFKGTLTAKVEGKVEKRGGGGQWMIQSSVELGPGEEKVVELKKPWPEAHLWTPDDPYLYNLVVSLDSSTSTSTSARVDALRQRFGFREFTMKGNRFFLNGIPFIARAGWILISGLDYETDLEYLRQFKKRGFNAVRVFVGQGRRAAEIDLMDEAGIFSMIGGCTENGGGGWTDRVSNDGNIEKDFWANYDRFNEHFVRDFRNHPGVIIWSLGCEFSAMYCGQGTGREKWVAQLICAAADKVMKLDPTRTWTENGGVEMGYPIKGPGPCPSRSFHYPVPLNTEGAALPDVAYWYPDGQVPWQKVGGFDKPAIITEDCYHGMQDSFRSMSRYANDDVYTDEGYYAALRKGFGLFAEGYYAGGLAWWEPWMPFAGSRDNKLFGDFEQPSLANGNKGAFHEPIWQCAPEWKIAMRPFFANVFGGEADVRTLYLYNQTFSPKDVVLTRVEKLDGKELTNVVEKLTLQPGVKFERALTLAPPSVTEPANYEVLFSLTDAKNQQLTTNSFSFTVFPRELKLRNLGDFALVAPSNSPLAAYAKQFHRGVFAAVADALAKKPRFLVVAKALDVKEGKRVDGFVQQGGRALLVNLQPGDWAPVDPRFDKMVRNTWRRRVDAMKNFPNAALSCWRTNDCVTTSVIPKDGIEDSWVIQDCALTDGLSGAVTTWLFRGKGAYLLAQLPLFERWNDEPAAKHYFAALLDELDGRRRPELGRRFALYGCDNTNSYTTIDQDCPRRSCYEWRHVTTCGPSYREIFEASGILEGKFTNALEEADVVFMDGSCGITAEMMTVIEQVTVRKGTVIVSELPEDTDRSRLFTLGCQLQPTRQWRRDERGEFLPDGRPHTMGEFPFWTVPVRSGAFAGLTADDFLWYPQGLVSKIMDGRMLGDPYRRIRIKHDDSLMTAKIKLFEDARGTALCEPCAAVSIPYNKGTVVLSTIRFRSFYGRYERQVRYILRTLLNNFGCSTSVAGEIFEQEPLDIKSSFNRNLWRDPKYRQADGTWSPEAWFGDDNDFRYFPVNLCGWSTASNNYCPKGEFPKQPMLLAGKRFIIQDPEQNGGKAVLYIAPGESVVVKFDHEVRANRFRLLGTAFAGGKAQELGVTINGVEQVFDGEDHFGPRWWASPKKHGMVAWAGETPKDPNGGVYAWLCPNPDPAKSVSEITFTARQNCRGFVLLAITAERAAE